nr:hypothetical protein [Pseudomonas cichorii]
MARYLNAGKYESATIERIAALRKLIENHTNTVSDAIHASLERWKISQ